MDPVSITCTVGAISRTVFNISWTLTRFIKDTKNVNQSVKDLAVEVSNLIGALKAVQAGLGDPAIRNAEIKANKADSLELWRSVNGSLLNTRATVDKLDEALESIRENKTNFAKQAVRQLKLNLKQDEINAIRAQFRTHISALQMTLLMMNVRATCMTSEITAELGPKIEKLGGMIEELKQDIQASKTLNDADHVPELISAKHAERLNKTAQKILSSASTMYSQSEWGGSVFGEVLDDLSRQRMHEWIPPAFLVEESVSQTTLSEQLSPRSGESIFSESEQKSILSTDPTEMLSLVEEDDDTGGEFDFEVAEKFLQQGTKSAAQEDYASAITFINAGHAQSETLTLEQKQKLDLRGSQLLLARCNYHSGNLVNAEMQLITYAEKYPPTIEDSTAVHACEASHLLSQVYLRKGKVSAARTHCRKAMIGRRRILGKEHKTYFESLFLLAEICEVSKAPEEAEVYLDMIPEELKSTFVKVAAFLDEPFLDANKDTTVKSPTPPSGQALHASVLFDFDSLDPQPEYVPDTALSPTLLKPSDLERNFSSNNPFRRHLSNKIDVIQRAQTDAKPESRPQITEPEAPNQSLQRTKTTGAIQSTSSPSDPSSATPLVSEVHKVTSPENLETVDWSLLWRFVTKVDVRLLPIELLQGADKPSSPAAKFITSSMLKKASIDTLSKIAMSLAAPAASVISPLHLAACINHMELALYFLSKEFYDVNRKCPFFSNDEPKNKVGNTPMHCAAQFGRTDMMRLLLKDGADVSIKNQSGYTPLHVAVAFGNLEAASQLYNPESFTAIAGEMTPLHLAAKYQRTAIMQVLLESWSDLETEDADGFTALHMAADANASDCVEELLQRGANPEALDSRTWTALHLATKKGHVRTVQRLLSYNARVDAKTNKGETALHLSVRHRQVQVFRKLLGYGAAVDAQNYEGLTALHIAVDDRQRGTIDTLIQRGASLELQEIGTKKRPLHLAVLKGNADVVRMLLQAGAQTTAVDANGRSPQDISQSLRYTEIYEAIRQVSEVREVPQRLTADEIISEDSNKIALAANNQEASASYIPKPAPVQSAYYEQPGLEVSFAEQVSWPYHHRSDWATASDWTPLHRAAYLGQKDLVMSLVNQGASIMKQTREGYTARGLAAIQSNVAIEAFLEGLEMRGPSIRSKISRLFVRSGAS